MSVSIAGGQARRLKGTSACRASIQARHRCRSGRFSRFERTSIASRGCMTTPGITTSTTTASCSPGFPRPCREALEIGCGAGAFSHALAARAERVLALDLSPEMIRVARAREPRRANLEFELADVSTWPFPSERFDCIASIATLHHVDARALLPRLRDALRPGGVLLILDLVSDEGVLDLARSALAVGANRAAAARPYRPAAGSEAGAGGLGGARAGRDVSAALRGAGALPGAAPRRRGAAAPALALLHRVEEARMKPVVEGGCLCGAVRYRASGESDHPTLCHCNSCRRAAGAPVVAWTTFPPSRFEFTKGTPARYRSSPPVVRTFCSTCGTPLTYQHTSLPGRGRRHDREPRRSLGVPARGSHLDEREDRMARARG